MQRERLSDVVDSYVFLRTSLIGRQWVVAFIDRLAAFLFASCRRREAFTWNINCISNSLGISTLSSCGNPQTLPELPAGDEHRLQRAALNLQQKLILREWLKENRLQSYYSRYCSKLYCYRRSRNLWLFRLISIEVTSLEDVYWIEDSRASQILGKDFAAWNHCRQKLPTSKAQLEILKAELWSTVVKTSNHKDAWTYGGMLVVSVSVAGLVTLGE